MDRSRTPRRNLVADVPLGPPVPLEHSKGPQALVWRQHCRDTFLHNTESTVKLHATIKKATDAGAVGAEDFARAGASGKASKNLARDCKRTATKGIDFPKPYLAQIPLGQGECEPPVLVDYPFMLPHEVLYHMMMVRGMDIKVASCVEDRLDQKLGAMKLQFCKRFQKNPDTCLCLGFHGDGVPYTKSLKSASVAVFNWNLLNALDSERHLFATVPEDKVCACGCHGRHTIDAMLSIFAWSMKIMLGGVHPLTRHDNEPLDAQRSGLAGMPLGFTGGLFQARGDWSWYQHIFGFPGWTGKVICWRCKATSDDTMPYWDFSPGAKWRTNRYKAGCFFKAQRLAGSHVSPLFSCPGYTLDMVCIGVMHCVDLGVTQEVLGNIFSEFMDKGGLPGSTQKIRCEALWKKLQNWYKVYNPTSQIQTLNVKKFKKGDGSAPSLKGKAAESRHLTPFAVHLAQELHLKYDTEHTLHVLQCATALMDFYKVLSDWQCGDVAGLCQVVCSEYSWLNQEAWLHSKNAWRIKPKFHMFQEMCQFQSFELGNPRGFWEYKDEDFVGWVSKLARRWGGPCTYTCQADSVFLRYRGLASG